MKKKWLLLSQYVAFLLLLPLAVFMACDLFSSRSATSLPYSGKRAYRHAAALSYRTCTSPDGSSFAPSASYIRRHLVECGLKIAQIQCDGGRINHISGILPGASDHIIILATSYNKAGEGRGSHEAFPAAAGVLLELARSSSVKKQGLTVWFTFLDGASDGGKGNKKALEFIRSLAAQDELSRVKAFIYIDPACQGVDGTFVEKDSTQWLSDSLRKSAGRLGCGSSLDSAPISRKEVHALFIEKGIPALALLDSGRIPGEVGPPDERMAAEKLHMLGRIIENLVVTIDPAGRGR
ncbi:MAG: hypothetical protein RDV48_09960 [Candidatus Eremiobacteraeota bacterium]|nr:hypothetical protein [Candidatus Eremiobacteraeota bacterium]